MSTSSLSSQQKNPTLLAHGSYSPSIVPQGPYLIYSNGTVRLLLHRRKTPLPSVVPASHLPFHPSTPFREADLAPSPSLSLNVVACSPKQRLPFSGRSFEAFDTSMKSRVWSIVTLNSKTCWSMRMAVHASRTLDLPFSLTKNPSVRALNVPAPELVPSELDAPSPDTGHFPPMLHRAMGTTTPPTAKNKFPPGSLPYAAPELLKPSRSRSRERSNDSDKPNPAQDIWALGCVLHALFTGKLPFSDAFEPRLQMKIVRGIWDEGVVSDKVLVPHPNHIILLVDLAERWSIAMVDEYAWAIGIADEEAEREAMRAQRGRSVGRGRRGLSAIRDRDGAKDDDTGSVQGGGLASMRVIMSGLLVFRP
ncbi:Pkinase domain-containing protein [Rhizoctonia solani AG-1 IA]|uniref:Pkinase domain-containing protein n=1 Tax=Thanatephorus cucumeris (strain AG1-IA) TaxID=983506 RepID=L8X1C8_THACA|nr:Pkinase domain-containing protein [Rhizoctonia solani AG-1 IA]